MRTPNFVIVGAPKCGTTSLATWLGEHPDVFMSPVKEPNYFCPDVPVKRAVSTPEAYSELFTRAARWQARGEASASYFFSTAAIPAILEANPEASVIAMVRNPLDMVVSYHSSKLFNVEELEADFERAWRRSPHRAPNQQTSILDYRAVGKLGLRIREIAGVVPQQQLHVVVFDDLQTAPGAVYNDVLLFLGIRPDERHEFPVLNARKQRVYPRLAALMKRPPGMLGTAKRAAKRMFPRMTRVLGHQIHLRNRRSAPNRSLSDELRREMVAEFRDDVVLLGEVLGRDLRHWMDA
jgi:hypothetical protein